MICSPGFPSSTICSKMHRKIRVGHSPTEQIIGKIWKHVILPCAGRVPHQQSDATQQECLQWSGALGSGSAGTNNRETPVEEEHADKSRIAVCVRRSPAAHQILETISIELRLRLPHSIFPIIFSSGECVFLDISFHFANDVLKPFPLSCVQDAFTLEEFAFILCPSWQFFPIIFAGGECGFWS